MTVDGSGRQPISALPTSSSMNLESDQDHLEIRSASLPSVKDGDSTFAVAPHKFGVKPLGNETSETFNLKLNAGLFSLISDELLLEILEALLPEEIVLLGGCCKFLYVFSHFEDLWRTVYMIESTKTLLEWNGSWRSAVVHKTSQSIPISCHGVFSDVLYRPFQCVQVPLRKIAAGIPGTNQIKRFETLSKNKFEESYTDQPFILGSCVESWPVFREWSSEKLLDKYSEVLFQAEAVKWSLSVYHAYAKTNQDESPLYLFDQSFVEKMDIEAGSGEGQGDYWAPGCFGHDLFTALRDNRPDCRWLIVGPARSGSTFHKDPNATSAWNAVIRGSKYWLMFPPSIMPPGVFISPDGGEVTSPLSIAEYLLSFHAQARRTPGCIEGICNEGELVHVPSGWWHFVVNLEETIAITQNFVAERNLMKAIQFLRDKPDQVSGFRADVEDPYALFVRNLRAERPDLVGLLEVTKKRKWKDLLQEAQEGEIEERPTSKAFSFGFSNDDDADEEIP